MCACVVPVQVCCPAYLYSSAGGCCYLFMYARWHCTIWGVPKRHPSRYTRRRTPPQEEDTMANQEQLDLLKQGREVWNTWRKQHPSLRPDLSEANLSDADLSFATQGGAILREVFDWGTDLSEANLSGADLSGANLSGANLRQANLRQANLSGASLSRAYLSYADLNGANLSGANLSDAELERVELSGANLSGANLRGAELAEVSLEETDLSGANLSSASLGGVSLVRANLSKANLTGAHLFYGTDLSGANLSGADLSNTKMDEKTRITPEQIGQAKPGTHA